MPRKKFDSISIITKWLNEEDFAPFFLRYYGWADELIVMLDDRTNDRSLDMLRQCRRTRIIPCHYPDGFNCIQAYNMINDVAGEIKTDWVICVDSDEFLFPRERHHREQGIRKTLTGVKGDVVYVDYWQMYRHHDELPLDVTVPVLNLRRYGDPDRETGYNKLFRKPAIVRTGLRIEWEVGHHNFYCADKVTISKTRFDGAHWNMADVEIAIKRRMNWRREVLSKDDVERQFSSNNYDITEEQIRDMCRQHEHDPQVF